MANIKKIQLPDITTPFEIEALHFNGGTSLDTPEQWKAYIDNLAKKGTEIKKLDSLPSLSTDQQKKDAYTNYAGDIIFILDTTAQAPNQYNEYVGITGKVGTTDVDNAITKWELIGTTQIDLSNYVTKGTYTTLAPSSNETGSAGGATIQGSNFTFTGTTKTITLEKNYQPKGTISKPGITMGGKSTITYVTGVKSTGGSTNAITGYANFSGGSASGTFVTGVKSNASVTGTKNVGFSTTTNDVMYGATVSDGVLSWSSANAATQDTHSMTQMAFNTGTVSWTSASLGTPSTASVILASGLTTSSFDNYTSASLDATPTFTGTTETITLTTNYQPQGSIGGSQTVEGHTHTLGNHTHNINLQ